MCTGAIHALTEPPTEKEYDFLPRFSPDGLTIAFVRGTTFDSRDVYLVPTVGGEPTRATRAHMGVHGLDWMPGAEELILAATTGGSTRSELWRLSLRDQHIVSIPVTAQWCANPTVASHGRGLVYEMATCETKINQILCGEDGETSETTLIASTRWDGQPQLSPDGARIAFASSRSGASELWVCESDGARPVQITELNAAWIRQPCWSPDGRQIAFSANSKGKAEIQLVDIHNRRIQRLTDGAQNDHVRIWSRDGAWIYFASDRSETWQIWRMPASGGVAEQITRNGGMEVAQCLGEERFIIRRSDERQFRTLTLPEPDQTPVLVADLPASIPENWVLQGDKIYWLQRESQGGAIYRYDLLSASTMIAARSELLLGPGLTVSPDGKRMLFGCADRIERDLMLVEGFH